MLPSSRSRSTLPYTLDGSCANRPLPAPVVRYSVPSAPNAMRDPELPSLNSPANISVKPLMAVPSKVPRPSATALFAVGLALSALL
jgi:hypothetical protein